MHGSCCVSRGTAYKSSCFTILLQILISQIFGQICIGSGHDLTIGFDWLDGKYVLNSTLDAWRSCYSVSKIKILSWKWNNSFIMHFWLLGWNSLFTYSAVCLQKIVNCMSVCKCINNLKNYFVSLKLSDSKFTKPSSVPKVIIENCFLITEG